MSEEEPERGILLSLPHPRIKHIKQMNFRATIVYKERHLGGTIKWYTLIFVCSMVDGINKLLLGLIIELNSFEFLIF